MDHVQNKRKWGNDMSLVKHEIKSERRMQLINITDIVKKDLDIQEGICVVYTPHTTCGISVNENADPSVCNDMIYGYEKVFPTNDDFYHHMEGNSAAHMKSSAFGCNQTFIVHECKLILGIWQGIYFCEFDGPRNRSFYVKTIEE